MTKYLMVFKWKPWQDVNRTQDLRPNCRTQ